MNQKKTLKDHTGHQRSISSISFSFLKPNRNSSQQISPQNHAGHRHRHRRNNTEPVNMGSVHKSLDINDLSEEDFNSLRAQDPFMYYSIQGIHKAAILFKEVDLSNTSALCHYEGDSQVGSNTTARDGTEQEDSEHEKTRPDIDTKVVRRSRISFEADQYTQMWNELAETETDEETEAVLMNELADIDEETTEVRSGDSDDLLTMLWDM